MNGVGFATFSSAASTYAMGGVGAARGGGGGALPQDAGTPAVGAVVHPPGCACASCASCSGSGSQGASTSGTSNDEKNAEVIRQLKARDQNVRTHEAAHLAAAGGLAKGGPSFSYQRGPDGNLYAVGGSVNIDVSPVAGNPQATIAKAAVVRAAALAPADPSSQDRSVAAAASQMAVKAQSELAAQQAAPAVSATQKAAGGQAPQEPQASSATTQTADKASGEQSQQVSPAGRRLQAVLAVVAGGGHNSSLAASALSVYA